MWSDARSPKQKIGALGVAFRPESECLRVVLLGRGVRIEGGRSVAGFAEGQASPVRELGSVHACRAGELECRLPVVGKHLGVVLRTPEALDPLCDTTVLLGTVGSGDLPVGDVANEGVCKRELGLAFDGRALLAAHEPLALE